MKPANLLVSRQNTICLTDFGSAIDCGGSTSYSVKQSCISTVWAMRCFIDRSYYNAPEILLGLPEITCSVDVWSLALTWLRLLGVQISPSVLFVCRVDSQNPTEIQMCQSIFEFLGESPNSDSWPVPPQSACDLGTSPCSVCSRGDSGVAGTFAGASAAADFARACERRGSERAVWNAEAGPGAATVDRGGVWRARE